MNIDLIKRNYNVLTKTNNMEHLYTFKNFPIFMGSTDNDISEDIYVDMSWSICKETGVIQLDDLIPLNILYCKSHGAGSVGELWKIHHSEFSKFISQFDITSVLEIGGGDGILAKEFHKINNIPWVILEPNSHPIENSDAVFIKGFFDDNFDYPNNFDTVIHSHLFEHIYDPNQFIEYFSKYMSDGQYLLFSIPNMKKMLELKYTNCINFEHTFFLIEPYVEYLLNKYGFSLIKKEYFLNDHSIFYAYVKDSTIVLKDIVNLYDINKNIYFDYIDFHIELIDNINKRIEHTENEVYLFGAHIFSQYLISFGLNIQNITSILDNNVNKQGKRFYGTNMIIQSPNILKYKKNPIVILRTGSFNEEIKNDILTNINSNVEFL